MLAEDFLNLFEGFGDLLFSVGGHEAEADEGVVGSDSGRHNGIDEDAFVEEFAGDEEREVVVADEERDNRGGSVADFAAHVAEAVKGIVCNLPKMLHTLGLCFHDIKGGVDGSGRCGCDGGGEDVGA